MLQLHNKQDTRPMEGLLFLRGSHGGSFLISPSLGSRSYHIPLVSLSPTLLIKLLNFNFSEPSRES